MGAVKGRLPRAGRALAIWLAACAVAAVAPQPSVAQGFSLGTASPVRTLDQERLFLESQFGRRVQREIEAASRALAAQNEELQAQLVAEELELAELRPTLPADEFRRLAEEFDTRVTRIRNEQEARARAISAMRDRERQRFFEAALPVLAQVLRETGAVAIIDSRTVILATDQLDITDLALFMLDQRLGDGASGDRPDTEGDVPRPDPPPEERSAPNGPGGPVLLPMTPDEPDQGVPDR